MERFAQIPQSTWQREIEWQALEKKQKDIERISKHAAEQEYDSIYENQAGFLIINFVW